MAVTDAAGTSLSVSVQSASPHKVKLVEHVLEEKFIDETPERPIGNKADDPDPLDERLKQQGIEMVAPHRSNKGKKKAQDGRKQPGTYAWS